MTRKDRDFERELYPFLQNDTPRAGSLDALLAEVRRSTVQKCRETVELRGRIHAEYAETLLDAAEAMAAAFARGGKLLAFGNGGSATDAADAVADCLVPPNEEWPPLPALSLVGDTAIVTALANDVGIENVFSRQIIAYAERGDIALGFSTSGDSASVVTALAEAKRRVGTRCGVAKERSAAGGAGGGGGTGGERRRKSNVKGSGRWRGNGLGGWDGGGREARLQAGRMAAQRRSGRVHNF